MRNILRLSILLPLALLLSLAYALAQNGNREIVLFDSMNVYGVGSGPMAPAKFSLRQPYVITQIMDYHWNSGRGTIAGTIGLKDANGRMYGPWRVKGSPGQGGVPNALWTATPNVRLPAGEYTIVDSELATWSQNSHSGNRGMCTVKGYPSNAGPLPTPTPKPTPTPTAQTSITATVENKSTHNVLIWPEGHEPRNLNGVLQYHLDPGWKSGLKVSIPANGRITFVAGSGSSGGSGSFGGKVLATCTWTFDPRNTSRIPYVVFDGSHLVCGDGRK